MQVAFSFSRYPFRAGSEPRLPSRSLTPGTAELGEQVRRER